MNLKTGVISITPSTLLAELHGVAFEILKFTDFKGVDMCGSEDYRRSTALFKCILPALCTQAPLISFVETGKAEFRDWSAEVVAGLA